VKVFYIAGPFRAPSRIEIFTNVQRAVDVAVKYKKRGYATIIPHLNTPQYPGAFDAHMTEEEIMAEDLAILSKCDGVVMCKGWEKSEGALTEHDFALANDMEIIYD